MLTAEPQTDMHALFNHYVERHFAQNKDYCDLLQKEGVEVAPYENQDRVTRFAAQVD